MGGSYEPLRALNQTVFTILRTFQTPAHLMPPHHFAFRCLIHLGMRSLVRWQTTSAPLRIVQ